MLAFMSSLDLFLKWKNILAIFLLKFYVDLKYHTNHIADFCIFKVSSRIHYLNIPYIALCVEINLAILLKTLIDTIELPQTRMSLRPNRLSTCLNSNFRFNYISTPFFKEASLKYEPAMCKTFLIYGLTYKSL